MTIDLKIKYILRCDKCKKSYPLDEQNNPHLFNSMKEINKESTFGEWEPWIINEHEKICGECKEKKEF